MRENNSAVFLILLILILRRCDCLDFTEYTLKFPSKFSIGSSSSAYQHEGAWNISGKNKSIMDYFTHAHPKEILDNSTGDIAADMYHKYNDDIKLIRKVGLDTFRFSISWARLLPNGYPDYINQEALDFYNDFIDKLRRNGITPSVTIYHWDHPESLEMFGGWLNERMAHLYADFARIVFREFGDRVKMFTTVNQPRHFCSNVYHSKYALINPKIKDINTTDTQEYKCIHNMLKGHALAYRIYYEEFRERQLGKVGIAVSCNNWYNKNKNDRFSTDMAFDFQCGHVLHPIFSKEGDYSPTLKSRIAWRSRKQGYKDSRLPTFTKEWISKLKGSADFLGISHYTSKTVESLPLNEVLRWPNDEGIEYTNVPNTPQSADHEITSVPWGLGDLLRTIKSKYNNPLVYVFENGTPDHGGTEDDERINVLYAYMREMLIAIKEDGCNVAGYYFWSFLDGFEWKLGHTVKYGLVEVDFHDKNKKRTLKKSATWIRYVLQYRRLLPPYYTNYFPRLQ